MKGFSLLCSALVFLAFSAYVGSVNGVMITARQVGGEQVEMEVDLLSSPKSIDENSPFQLSMTFGGHEAAVATLATLQVESLVHFHLRELNHQKRWFKVGEQDANRIEEVGKTERCLARY
jgi:hypothetical protein